MATPNLDAKDIVGGLETETEESERLQLLVEATSALLGRTSVDEILPRLLGLAQRTLYADAYALWRFDRDEGTWSVAESAGLSDGYVTSATAAIRGNAMQVSLDEPVVAENIATAEWLTPAHREAHLAEGNQALLAIGLTHRDELLGTLAFYFREPHRFTSAELSAAAALANLAATAIATAELYEQQTKASEERRFIAEASAILASSLDYATTLENMAALAVTQFADWCAIDMVADDGSIERLTIAHRDPEKMRWADELAEALPPPDPDSPFGVPNVIRTGEPELITEIDDELLVEATRDVPELLEILRELGLTSSMCVPLVARGRVLGAITFVSEQEDRRYDRFDLALAQDLARRAAVAVDNALLLRRRREAQHAAEAAHERLSVLADASQQLASTLDYERTLANIAKLIVPRYADWYAADVIDEDGSFRRLAVVHRDPDKASWAEKSRTTYAADPNEPEGTGRVVRTGKPLLYDEISDELLAASTRDAEHYEVLKQLGMESAMVVPLTAGGRTFGALMLVSADPERRYDEKDLDFAQHLGRRAAVAIDNALLYREAQQRARASLVVEHVADGVVLIDRMGVIRLWNPAAERITGLGAEEVVGRRADAVFPTWASIAPLAETSGTRAETRPAEVNGRELWLSVTGVAFVEGSVYAFRDLTAERAVERLKSDFVATVSHELRTPLAAIYGAALTLRREDVRLGEPQRMGLLEVVATESDRLARIVNDILWASRLESGTMQTTIQRCDAVELARGVVDAAAQYVPPNIHVAFTAVEDAPYVAADPDKVRQVLGNLVENAVKYSPDGGEVGVHVEERNNRLRITVRDDGLGIPPSEHERIFEKFYRLDPNLTRGVGGTGLGLYISRELVSRMGGRIWVESAGAGGSTFFVELPLAA
jgi:PAS domain S-box-containing protein